MGLKAIAGGPITDAKITTEKTPLKSGNSENKKTTTETAPLAADKQFGANLLGNYNRARIEQKFLSQQTQKVQEDENKEILGVTTRRPFPKAVAPDESQESVLRRAYQEYAATAGISNEKPAGADKSPAEMFVEERMEANKTENNGEYRIFNAKTQKPYTDEEWKGFQEAGSIRMYPTDTDIESLKGFKSLSDSNFGDKTAVEMIEAMKEGPDSPRFAKAMETLRAYRDNPNFQGGFVDRMGADKFLELHAMVKGNSDYRADLQKTLSGATSIEPTYAKDVEHGPSIGQQIAQKVDVETLGELTSDRNYPMGKDFLIEAGKRVTTQDVGWKIKSDGGSVPGDYPIYNEWVNKGSNQVLAAISRSPEATAELLQDENFVKNSLRMSNTSDRETAGIVADIIRNGTSAEAKAKNPEAVDKALMAISQALADRKAITSQSSYEQGRATVGFASNSVNETVAKALVSAYINNPDSFSAAASLPSSRSDTFEGEDVRTFIGAIQPYYSVKDPQTGATVEDQMAAATALRYNNLLSRAEETGDTKYVTEAANLAGSFISGSGRANLENAKDVDARQEKFAKAVAIVSEVVTLNTMKGFGEIAADVAGKIVAASSENTLKGNNADNAVEQNRSALNNQQTTNMISIVQVYERAAFERANGLRAATPEQKQQAEQFLSDLQAYNKSLPDNAKILDKDSGRLISQAQMDGNRLSGVTGLFARGTGSDFGIRLTNRMQATFSELRDGTNGQIH